MPELVLGPLLRYVSETEATVWVETERALRGRGARPPRADLPASRATTTRWSASRASSRRRFYEYEVALDGELRWPAADSDLPPSAIRTFGAGKPLDICFGSCRVAVPHEAPYTKTKDETRRRARGRRALASSPSRWSASDRDDWPELLFLLGDQVYVDEGSPRTREQIRARRGTDDAARRGGDRLRGVHLALRASPGRTR